MLYIELDQRNVLLYFDKLCVKDMKWYVFCLAQFLHVQDVQMFD